MPIAIAPRVELAALPGLPTIEPGDDLVGAILAGIERADIVPTHGDVLVIASKMVSRAEGRFVDLAALEPGVEACALADKVGKDPRLVELVLRESVTVSRSAPGVLIVRHRLGFVSANAAIDLSNSRPAHAAPGSGPWALLVPEDPDASAARLRARLEEHTGVTLGLIISDSLGRPFRLGTVGAALGVAGVPALSDLRGQEDLHGRVLEHTQTALADQLAAAADMVAGQGAEGRGAVYVRGVVWDDESRRLWEATNGIAPLLRAMDEDLYA